MMYVQSGSMSLTLNGVPMQAVQNQVILVDCLLPHRSTMRRKKPEFYWMHIDGVNSVHSVSAFSPNTEMSSMSSRQAHSTINSGKSSAPVSLQSAPEKFPVP